MTRQQILARLERGWRDFHESYAGLTEVQILQPGVNGEWSVRDVIAHLTTWEQEAIKHLPTILKGGKPPRYSTTYGGIDAFNRIMTAQKKDLSLPQVQREAEAIHGQLVEFIAGVPEEQFWSETPFRHRLRLDTYSHYPKHAEAIRKWRERHGGQENRA
jgi:hypothetical protein